MKTIIPLICLTLFLTSCTTTSYFQVYGVSPVDESITSTEKLFFEDSNCIITYNLWSNGGNIGFNLYNKTKKDIHVNLDESNFILNGYAHDYFKNRTYTNSKNNTIALENTSNYSMTVSGINNNNLIQSDNIGYSNTENNRSSSGYAVSTKEKPVISIPPSTSKSISEYSINHTIINHCDLYTFPRRKQVNTVTYERDNSPIIFSNRISYKIAGKTKIIEHRFFISEITNYPKSEFYEMKNDEYCEQKNIAQTRYFKHYKTNKFYIEYETGNSFYTGKSNRLTGY